MSELQALRERVEKAEGPDRSIDGDIVVQLGLADRYRNWYEHQPETDDEWQMLVSGKWVSLPAFSASIDAAVALIERKLPGYGFEVLASDRDSYRAAVWPWISSRGTRAQIGHQHSYAKTPALALIAALLSALESTNG